MEIYAKPTKLWGPQCSFQLAVAHHAWRNWQQLLSCLLELLSVTMVTSHVVTSTVVTGTAHHWTCLEGTRPKLVFYPLHIFIYDSPNFGTAFHNTSQEKCLTEVSTCIYFYTTMQVSASDPAFSSFVHTIKVFKVKRKSLAAGWNYQNYPPHPSSWKCWCSSFLIHTVTSNSPGNWNHCEWKTLARFL